jgi:hypothetical protein
MLLPAGARARLTFGIDLTAILDSGVSDYAAEFAATLEDLESGRKIESMSIRVDLSGESWNSHRWDLEEHAFRRVELCLMAPLVRSGNTQIANTDAYWGNPGISGSADREVRKWSQEPVEEVLTGTELEVRQEHLKTLGYID